MKVVFCAYDSAGYLSGPNAWLKRLLPALSHKGIEVKILFQINGGAIDECQTLQFFLRHDTIQCAYICRKDYPYTEQQVRWILKEVALFKPSIFVPNLSVPAYYACRWIKKAGISCIGVIHSYDDFHYGLIEEFVNGHKAHAIDSLVCVSSFTEQIVRQTKKRDIKIAKIPCGVPLPAVKKEFNDHRKLRLMYVGRLVENAKQISLLTKAFCQVTEMFSEVEAFIYGDGPCREQVVSIINSFGSSSKVVYKGKVDSEDMQSVMIENDVIVLLSDYEGLPVSMMEAMSCGLVPLGLLTDHRSGIGELIEHEKNGLVVKDREQSFYMAVNRLATHKNLMKKLSGMARRTIEIHYSNEICTNLWIDLFNYLHKADKKIRDIKIPGIIFLPRGNPKIKREDNRRLSVERAKNLKSKLRQIYNYLKAQLL